MFDSVERMWPCLFSDWEFAVKEANAGLHFAEEKKPRERDRSPKKGGGGWHIFRSEPLPLFLASCEWSVVNTCV